MVSNAILCQHDHLSAATAKSMLAACPDSAEEAISKNHS
jgi:hypothetical protein